MVTIYTERDPRIEAFHEERPFNFGRLALISLATALLLSLLASFNLNSDVKNLTTIAVGKRVAPLHPAQIRTSSFPASGSSLRF